MEWCTQVTQSQLPTTQPITKRSLGAAKQCLSTEPPQAKPGPSCQHTWSPTPSPPTPPPTSLYPHTALALTHRVRGWWRRWWGQCSASWQSESGTGGAEQLSWTETTLGRLPPPVTLTALTSPTTALYTSTINYTTALSSPTTAQYTSTMKYTTALSSPTTALYSCTMWCTYKW